MIDRRHLLGLAAGTVVLAAAPAFAQSWKTSFPELVLAVVPAENASGVTERYQPFVARARYEVHLDRKFERMLAMLLRFKNLRKGTVEP